MTQENSIGRPSRKQESPFTQRFKDLAATYTHQYLADKIGTSRQNIGKWIRGETNPDIDALVRVSECFNVSTDYLLGISNTFEPISFAELSINEKEYNDHLINYKRNFQPLAHSIFTDLNFCMNKAIESGKLAADMDSYFRLTIDFNKLLFSHMRDVIFRYSEIMKLILQTYTTDCKRVSPCLKNVMNEYYSLVMENTESCNSLLSWILADFNNQEINKE
ncbi:MAG: helix-turn-helix transcriptional regulator [Oscillospiraceae bacterium]